MNPVPTSLLLAKSLPASVDESLAFSQPWEARAFAIVVELSQAGHFSWGDWVDHFSEEVAAATAVEAAGGAPKTYYEQWLAAAEKLLVAKGLTSRDQLASKRFAIGAVGGTHLLNAGR